MKQSSLFILVFSIALALFFFGPPLLSKQFGFYPLMKIGDLFDVFTPLVLIPLYWLLFRLNGGKAPDLKENLIFLLLAAFWVEGQGMHLSANSIGHFLKGTEGSDIYNLSHFYDEVLSHYLWHFGVIGLSALILWRQWRNPSGKDDAGMWPLILAGVVYGFSFFVIVIEGGTAPLGIPFAILIAVLGWILGRKGMRQQPLITFFLIGYSVATLFFIGWGIYWGGLPEFSQVGIID